MKVLVHLSSDIPCFHAAPEQVGRLSGRLAACGGEARFCGSEQEFLAELPDAWAAVVWTFRQEWFALAPRLRHVCTPAAGRDYFRVTPPAQVTLHYGSFHGAIMAETALGAMLSMAHGLLPFAESMRRPGAVGDEGWPRIPMAVYGRLLAGSTAVILGCGHIGTALARLLAGLGVRVIGVTRGARPSEPGIERVTADRIDAVLPEADHVVCFLPSGPETDRLLDARRLALLKPSAVLYNFGRGNVMDEEALATALRAGRLRGAVLDVFREEPLPPDSPLRGAPGCFLYPHASAFVPEYLDLYFKELAAQFGTLRQSSSRPADS